MKRLLLSFAMIAAVVVPAWPTDAAVMLDCTVLSAGQSRGSQSLVIVGQTMAGTASGGSINMTVGAMPCLAPAATTNLGDCGDFDNDGDVDLSDFSQFSLCFGGANNPPAGSCPIGIDADFDNDGDVDLSDFSVFSLCFTGSL